MSIRAFVYRLCRKRVCLARLLVAAFILFPFSFLLVLSFGRRWAYPALLPGEWTLSNWLSVWGAQAGLGESLALSLALSTGIAAVSTAASFWVSRQVAGHRYRRHWLLLAYLPYVFAPVVLAACLQYFFIRAGLSGKVWGIALAQLFITFPYGVIFFASFWTERMLALEQLIATLGGSTWQAYARVLLPVAKDTLMTCFFQLFLISWFEYGLTTLIGVGKVQTLTLKVFQYVNEANIFFAALASCLLVLPPVALLWLNKRYVFSRYFATKTPRH
ncbi:MAG: ABC transporter permease subunit [Lewinellaceae bacterium]|nr:ABC transporter permease subunit [Lewinellaceae bacterium]